MEEFLNDYVSMLAESSEVELTPDQLHTVVNNIMNNDVVWDVMDTHIQEEFEDLELKEE